MSADLRLPSPGRARRRGPEKEGAAGSATPSRRFDVAVIASRSRIALSAVRRSPRERVAEWGLWAAVLIACVGVRFTLLGTVSIDMTAFLTHWFGYLRGHGFTGLGDDFADYNVPYLYILFVGTNTPATALQWVKLVGALSDVALASGAALLVLRLRRSARLATALAAVVLLLPEVLTNSAVWGQADSLYTALVVWAMWAAAKDRPVVSWVLYVLALAFKLQAVFVLPVMLLLLIKNRQPWRAPLIGAAAGAATFVPAMIAGRSVGSLVGVYANQAGEYPRLTLNAPTLYALLPEVWTGYFRAGGVFLAMGLVALLCVAVLRLSEARALGSVDILQLACACALLMTYSLPSMHERYFFLGNCLAVVCVVTDRRYLPLAGALQVTAVLAYSSFLFRQQTVPLVDLALVQAVLVALALWIPLSRLWRERAAAGRTTSDVAVPAPIHAARGSAPAAR